MKTDRFQEQIFHLSRIGIALTGIHDLDRLLDIIVRSARELTRADAGSLYIVEKDHLNFIITQNDSLSRKLGKETFRKLIQPISLPINHNSLAGYVADTGKTVNIKDVQNIPEQTDYRHDEKKVSDLMDYEMRTMLVAPMKNPDGSIIGVLQLMNAMNEIGEVVPFDEDFEFLVPALASQAAVALENARLTKALQNAQLDTIFRLSMAAEFRESGDPVHICRVSEYSAVLAEGMELPAEQVNLIRSASPLHDLGKMGLPDTILRKEGQLTPEESKLMQSHVDIGVNILHGSQSKILKTAETIILTHHEKFDGTGYPRGLKNGEIPVEGRIVALADAFEAMSTPSVYREMKNLQDVSKEIVTQSGKHFDPKVVFSFFNQQDTIFKIYQKWRHHAFRKSKPDWNFIFDWWKNHFPE